MDNKAQVVGIFIFLLIVVAIVLGGFLLYSIELQHGTSKDVVYGYDKGMIWSHAYLKNDHTTAYCFNDESFIPLLDESQRDGKEVIITYSKYIGKGFFCTTDSKYENVVITGVKFP